MKLVFGECALDRGFCSLGRCMALVPSHAASRTHNPQRPFFAPICDSLSMLVLLRRVLLRNVLVHNVPSNPAAITLLDLCVNTPSPAPLSARVPRV